MTDEHEHAMKVWREELRAFHEGRFGCEYHTAAAVIAADRAGLVAEIERLREALGEICRDSNPDWTEKRVYPTDVLDDIHTIAVRAYYKVSL